jgi:uncharacterized protein with GYD domain
MTHYLTRLSYSPQSWRHLVEAPHDRREPIADVVEQAGGTLIGLWYAFGDDDKYIVADLPDNVSAASVFSAMAASGGVRSMSTTVLLTTDEMLDALGRASTLSYLPPNTPEQMKQIEMLNG